MNPILFKQNLSPLSNWLQRRRKEAKSPPIKIFIEKKILLDKKFRFCFEDFVSCLKWEEKFSAFFFFSVVAAFRSCLSLSFSLSHTHTHTHTHTLPRSVCALTHCFSLSHSLSSQIHLKSPQIRAMSINARATPAFSQNRGAPSEEKS